MDRNKSNAGVKRRMEILETVNRLTLLAQVPQALRRPPDAHIARAKKKKTTVTSENRIVNSSMSVNSTDSGLVINLNKQVEGERQKHEERVQEKQEGNIAGIESCTSSPKLRSAHTLTESSLIHIKKSEEMLTEGLPLGGLDFNFTTPATNLAEISPVQSPDREFSPEIRGKLKTVYERIPWPTDRQVALMAQRLGVPESEIKAWFTKKSGDSSVGGACSPSASHSYQQQPVAARASSAAIHSASASQIVPRQILTSNGVNMVRPAVSRTIPDIVFQTNQDHPDETGRQIPPATEVPKREKLDDTIPKLCSNGAIDLRSTKTAPVAYPSVENTLRLKDFFESINASELDEILADVADVKLDLPLNLPTTTPEHWSGNGNQVWKSAMQGPCPSVNVSVAYPQYNSPHPPFHQASPSQANDYMYENNYNSCSFQERRDVAYMFPHINNALAQPPNVPQRHTMHPQYPPHNMQHFVPNPAGPIGYQQNNINPSANLRRDSRNISVPKKRSRAAYHVPIPQAPPPSWTGAPGMVPMMGYQVNPQGNNLAFQNYWRP